MKDGLKFIDGPSRITPIYVYGIRSIPKKGEWLNAITPQPGVEHLFVVAINHRLDNICVVQPHKWIITDGDNWLPLEAITLLSNIRFRVSEKWHDSLYLTTGDQKKINDSITLYIKEEIGDE